MSFNYKKYPQRRQEINIENLYGRATYSPQVWVDNTKIYLPQTQEPSRKNTNYERNLRVDVLKLSLYYKKMPVTNASDRQNKKLNPERELRPCSVWSYGCS